VTTPFRLTKTMPAGVIAAGAGVLAAAAVVMASTTLFHFGDRSVLALPLGVAAFAIFFVPLHLLLRRVTLRVFGDGLVVRVGLGQARFVPYGEIEGARAVGPAIVIAMHGGRDERFEVRPEQFAATESALASLRADVSRSIAAKIDEAIRAYRAGDSSETAALALDPRGDAPGAWLRALRAVGHGDVSTFRSAIAPTREELVAVATSPPPRRRVAAAIALRDELTGSEAPRIRVAASLCGAPRLGEQLIRVIESSSDEDLEALLDETSSRS
jgi:hypothetical protein